MLCPRRGGISRDTRRGGSEQQAATAYLSGDVVSCAVRRREVAVAHLARKVSPLAEEAGLLEREAPVCADARTGARTERLDRNP
jgi:hypothetical protein